MHPTHTESCGSPVGPSGSGPTRTEGGSGGSVGPPPLRGTHHRNHHAQPTQTTPHTTQWDPPTRDPLTPPC